jgi:hypothetical protein
MTGVPHFYGLAGLFSLSMGCFSLWRLPCHYVCVYLKDSTGGAIQRSMLHCQHMYMGAD